jgi:chromosome segregation ATPase
MNEKIQHIIQDIRRKKNALDDLLNQQKQKVNQLEQEIEQLKSDLESKNANISKLKNENAELQSLLEETKNQVINSVEPKNNGYEQIDELVREIEYCIGQLKK